MKLDISEEFYNFIIKIYKIVYPGRRIIPAQIRPGKIDILMVMGEEMIGFKFYPVTSNIGNISIEKLKNIKSVIDIVECLDLDVKTKKDLIKGILNLII